ncbi:MAG: hypothetical protein JW800_06070 [Candidatus Omnitrophica bacterium]|nr:hypothetical protein [Candidatus Omnitrophota bacterium]
MAKKQIKMKKMISILLFTAFFAALPFAVMAEETICMPFDIGSDTAFYSDYVWRGFTLDDDPVIQPSTYISAYGFTATFWSSFDIVSDDGVDGDEVDVTVDYTYEHELFSISLGHTWYTFPPAHTDTQEFYLGGSVNIPVSEEVVLSPSLTWFHDYGDTDDGGAKGDYFILDVAHSVPIPETKVTFDVTTSVAYNNEFFIEGDGGYYLIGCGLTIPLSDNLMLNPNINYSVPFGDLEDSGDGNQDDKLYYGASLAFTF